MYHYKEMKEEDLLRQYEDQDLEGENVQRANAGGCCAILSCIACIETGGCCDWGEFCGSCNCGC